MSMDDSNIKNLQCEVDSASTAVKNLIRHEKNIRSNQENIVNRGFADSEQLFEFLHRSSLLAPTVTNEHGDEVENASVTVGKDGFVLRRRRIFWINPSTSSKLYI